MASWTFALLLPSPERYLPSEDLREHSFEIAKTLHLTAYALCAILSGLLRVPWRYRWLLLVGLGLHAALTEYLQQFVRSRHPSLRDVGLDLVGISAGVVCSWKWWWK
jgi:VanZ family protein